MNTLYLVKACGERMLKVTSGKTQIIFKVKLSQVRCGFFSFKLVLTTVRWLDITLPPGPQERATGR